VISPVRNPLGNYEAWQRYTVKRGNQSHDPHKDVRDFVDAWAAHHTYWANTGLPLTVYRYEDLVDNPVGVLVKTLQASGLWDQCSIRDIDLLYVLVPSMISALLSIDLPPNVVPVAHFQARPLPNGLDALV
jgi:hypothetical protein